MSRERSANEFPEVSIGMWDFVADWYANNMTAEQRAVAESNGFHHQIPQPSIRDRGVAGEGQGQCVGVTVRASQALCEGLKQGVKLGFRVRVIATG